MTGMIGPLVKLSRQRVMTSLYSWGSDLIAFPEWHPHYPALTAKFCDFMRRHAAS